MNYSVNLQRASHVLGMGQLWEHGSCPAQRRSLQALKETSSGGTDGEQFLCHMLCPVARCLTPHGKPAAASELGTDLQRPREGVLDQCCRA